MTLPSFTHLDKMTRSDAYAILKYHVNELQDILEHGVPYAGSVSQMKRNTKRRLSRAYRFADELHIDIGQHEIR